MPLTSDNYKDLRGSVGDSDPESLSWAQHRGFQVFNHVFGSRLDLETCDASRFPMPFGNRLRFVCHDSIHSVCALDTAMSRLFSLGLKRTPT